MAQAGGPAAISGFLHQILHHLGWLADIELTGKDRQGGHTSPPLSLPRGTVCALPGPTWRHRSSERGRMRVGRFR